MEHITEPRYIILIILLIFLFRQVVISWGRIKDRTSEQFSAKTEDSEPERLTATCYRSGSDPPQKPVGIQSSVERMTGRLEAGPAPVQDDMFRMGDYFETGKRSETVMDGGYVKLYTDDQYQGVEWILQPGEYRFMDLLGRGIQIKQVASMILGPKTVVGIYYEDNFGGLLNDGQNYTYTGINKEDRKVRGYPRMSEFGWARLGMSIRVKLIK